MMALSHVVTGKWAERWPFSSTRRVETEGAMAALDNFRREMIAPQAFTTPNEIGDLLAACLQRACDEAGLKSAEFYGGGSMVTMQLTPTRWWKAIVVGPDAYQFYPGFVRETHIAWANVWVGENYRLEQFIAAVEEEIEAARAEMKAS